jgi:hypothetical protein
VSSGEESGALASESRVAPDYCNNNGGTRFITEEICSRKSLAAA